MKKIIKKSRSEEELISIGSDFSSFLKQGDVVFLEGELGAGKTTITKGIAKGIGISGPITSPTYSILKEYEKKLCHIDAYRVANEDIGIEDYINSGYILVIEWAKNIEDYVTPNYKIKINYTEYGREVTIYEY